MEYKLINKISSMKKTKTVVYLNIVLSLYGAIAQNARAFHWYVSWPNFLEYHELFEEICSHLSDKMDDIAERILAIQGSPSYRLVDYVETTNYVKDALNVDYKNKFIDDMDMLKDMQIDLEVISYKLSEIIPEMDDHPSQDLLIGEKFEIDKFLWKLRAIRWEQK